ncbi:hypothetical protein WJX75_006392 [Coccomyxa subellipsoidea]|uniref:Uncharacterized protein n=1 Tax=Coccomyxa subellipsoidea TaxID=248742 RepID=A0ABR2Z3G7_9CHLO
MDWDGLAYCTDIPLLADAQAAHTSETTSTNKADTGSAKDTTVGVLQLWCIVIAWSTLEGCTPWVTT